MDNNKKDLPIAVFDSGVGGISVLKEAVKIMPNEDFYFFGDSKNAPYGTKTTDEVRKLTLGHVNDFLNMGIKGLCIACNTATSAAVRVLRGMYPDLPIVGIEPAVKPAATFMVHPSVLVMATPMTIHGGKLRHLIDKFGADADIHLLSCPGLMEFVESGRTEDPLFIPFLESLLYEYSINNPNRTKIDAVVTGCTHYPFAAKEILSVLGPDVRLFDGGEGTARELKRRLAVADLLRDTSHKGTVTFEMSAGGDAKLKLCRRLLNS